MTPLTLVQQGPQRPIKSIKFLAIKYLLVAINLMATVCGTVVVILGAPMVASNTEKDPNDVFLKILMEIIGISTLISAVGLVGVIREDLGITITIACLMGLDGFLYLALNIYLFVICVSITALYFRFAFMIMKADLALLTKLNTSKHLCVSNGRGHGHLNFNQRCWTVCSGS